MTAPSPETRDRIRQLFESQWQVPVTVVHLGDVGPEYEVPGRRKDGTVKGERLVRRFFWNLIRYPIGGVVNVVFSVAGGGVANVFERAGRVAGPADARALDLVDPARKARDVWLTLAPGRFAAVDSGYSFHDPSEAELEVLWQVAGAEAPTLYVSKRRLSWPDGSEFVFDLAFDEVKNMRNAMNP